MFRLLSFILAFAACFLSAAIHVAQVATAAVVVTGYKVACAVFGPLVAPFALGVNSGYDSLILDVIGRRTLTTLGNRLAPLAAFCTDFSQEGSLQGQNIRVPLATGGATAQTNPTNWESGDTVLGNVNVPVNGYSVSFHITPREINDGIRLEQLVDINLQSFANKLIDVAMGPLTSTNFSNIVVSQTAIAAANIRSAWAAAAKAPTKNIILDATAFSTVMPSDKNGFELARGAYGFDGWFLNTRWTGAGTNVYGFSGGPEAVAIAARLPVVDDEVRADIKATSITLPGLGLTVMASSWVSRATRLRWASWDVMFGAAKGDNTASRVFVSA